MEQVARRLGLTPDFALLEVDHDAIRQRSPLGPKIEPQYRRQDSVNKPVDGEFRSS
jgi:hypothetical protein